MNIHNCYLSFQSYREQLGTVKYAMPLKTLFIEKTMWLDHMLHGPFLIILLLWILNRILFRLFQLIVWGRIPSPMLSNYHANSHICCKEQFLYPKNILYALFINSYKITCTVPIMSEWKGSVSSLIKNKIQCQSV